MGTTFTIAGNVKQEYLPFVLKPKANINKDVSTSVSLKDATPQFFSFRESKLHTKTGLLNICPTTYKKYMSKDIGNRLVYTHKMNSTRVSYNEIFNCLPAIQIREFLPDTKLDQCINFFGEMISQVKNVWMLSQDEAKAKTSGTKLTDAQKEKIKADASESFFTKFKNILWGAFDYLTGANQENNIYKDNSAAIKEKSGSKFYNMNSITDKMVHDWPYTLYYTLLSCVTTNIYELPCKTEDGLMYKSDGKQGWPVGTDIGISGLLTKIPGIGSILNSILGNIRINYMPWWESDKGSLTQAPEITVKFNLFNDTDQAAMQNFIFVNTIVPNNMWILYGMFLHSPCLYDVKLEGYGRLFACSATFSVNAMGVLRKPPSSWVRRLVKKHASPKSKGQSIIDYINKAELIKIPDVYQVTMTFNSLLPANFNNFIYQYSKNMNITEEYNSTANTFLPSMFNKLIEPAVKSFTSNIKKLFK